MRSFRHLRTWSSLSLWRYSARCRPISCIQCCKQLFNNSIGSCHSVNPCLNQTHADSATWLLSRLDILYAQPAAATMTVAATVTAGQRFRSQHVTYPLFCASLHQVLEKCSLYTCDQVQRDNMRKTQPAMLDASVGTSKGDSSAQFSVSQVDLSLSPPIGFAWLTYCPCTMSAIHSIIACNMCAALRPVVYLVHVVLYMWFVVERSAVNCLLKPHVFADIQP